MDECRRQTCSSARRDRGHLAKACGASKAPLYHDYSSKDDVLYDAMRAHLDKLTEAATMLFFGTINFAHTWFRPDGPVSAEQVATMATDLLFEGISGLGKDL